MTKHERNLWIAILLAIVVIFAMAAIGAAQTPTPTPGPCDHCPDPDGFVCAINYAFCVACWEACGQPIATPTPTVTPTPTATPTATPTPTPEPGPPCTLHVTGPGRVYLVAIWAHEWPEKCKRWTWTSETLNVAPGPQQINPRYVQGYPIGYEWWNATSGELLKSCGDTSREYPCPDIFDDGFETGNTTAWSRTIGG